MIGDICPSSGPLKVTVLSIFITCLLNINSVAGVVVYVNTKRYSVINEFLHLGSYNLASAKEASIILISNVSGSLSVVVLSRRIVTSNDIWI